MSVSSRRLKRSRWNNRCHLRAMVAFLTTPALLWGTIGVCHMSHFYFGRKSGGDFQGVLSGMSAPPSSSSAGDVGQDSARVGQLFGHPARRSGSASGTEGNGSDQSPSILLRDDTGVIRQTPGQKLTVRAPTPPPPLLPRLPPEHRSNIARTSLEHRSNIARTSLEHRLTSVGKSHVLRAICSIAKYRER